MVWVCCLLFTVCSLLVLKLIGDQVLGIRYLAHYDYVTTKVTSAPASHSLRRFTFTPLHYSYSRLSVIELTSG